MSQPGFVTIETLNQQIRSTVVRVLYHSFNDSQRPVVARGNIGEVAAGTYRMAYRVSLRDGFQPSTWTLKGSYSRAAASSQAITSRLLAS